MIRRHIAYLNYVLRHKWFVFRACRKLRVPLWSAILHDWDKFLPDEWTPYAETFYAVDGSTRKYFETEDFKRAWNLHQKRNRHHWQHWLLTWDRGETVALEMDEKDVREMVADWMGAGRAITGKYETAAWYEKNRQSIILNDKTRHRVEILLAKHAPDAVCSCGARGSIPNLCRRFGYCEAHTTAFPEPIPEPTLAGHVAYFANRSARVG